LVHTNSDVLILFASIDPDKSKLGVCEIRSGIQERPDIALVEFDAEPLGYDGLEVDASPPCDRVDGAVQLGCGLDHGRELGKPIPRQARLDALGPVVDEAHRR